MMDEVAAGNLYLTDTELKRRMGVGINSGRKALQAMRKHPNCPRKDIAGKTYWPAFRAFLDLWNNVSISAPSISAGMETQNEQTSHTGRARPRLAAAKERLGSRVAG